MSELAGPRWWSPAVAPAPRRNRNFWYAQPAKSWVEALPIGNGGLGGMIFGGVESERIELNEDTIWAGEKRDRLDSEERGCPKVTVSRRKES